MTAAPDDARAALEKMLELYREGDVLEVAPMLCDLERDGRRVPARVLLVALHLPDEARRGDDDGVS